MKRILFVAISATLLAAGCQKTEIINRVGDSIGFSTNMGKLTKAADAENSGIGNLQKQEFRVWAYADYEDENTTVKELDNIYDGIANMNVYYTPGAEGAEGVWAPAKQYYWPGVGKDLRFFAVSGVALGDDLSETSVVAVNINRTGTGESQAVAPTLTVTDFVVDHNDPNDDLMVADFVCQNQSKKEVNLTFRHALSKVEFLFKTLSTADADVYVQSVSVDKVNTKATLTVSENTDETTKATKPMIFKWSEATGEQTFKDDYDETDENFPTNVELLDKTEGATVDKEAMKLDKTATEAAVFTTWLVMPQTITGYQVKVRYVIGVREFESIFPLDTETLTAWGANQYVRYTVTLAPNLISFKPTVKDWDQYDADSTTEGNQDIEMEN